MSFILDALRKSEAARRRSETPDLFATLPQAAAPARSRVAWPLWAMAGFGAVSSAIALWLLLHRPDMPATPTAPPGTAAGAEASPAASDFDAAGDTATDTDADVATGTVSIDDVTPQPPATPPSPPVTAPVPMPSVAVAPATKAPAQTATPPVAAPAPAPPAAPPPANGDRATTLADLDPEVRRQLPALKLSMQVWNDDPQRRFVILDGQRLREGDTAGEVVVERITRTDVLLSWRGARLRLPAE